jgi:hypothetical protein
MKQRYIRVGDQLTNDVAVVVVRGGTLDRQLLRDDALRNYAIYGTYGISVFAVRDLSLDELAQQSPLIRFEQLTLVTVGALRSARLRLEATGRNPRHFDIVFDELEDGIARLAGCEHQIVTNPYHEA